MLLLYQQASPDHLFQPLHQQQMVHIRIQYNSVGVFFSDFKEYGCLRTDMCFAIRLPGSKHPFKKSSNIFQKQVMKTAQLRTYQTQHF